MAVVDGLSKSRMLAIEAASVVGGSISTGHLILTKHDGSTIDAGNVVGPAASISNGPPASPIGGQMFFDTGNFAGVTDLLASKNPTTSVANWLAYGFGYDTAVTFAVVSGGVQLTWGGTNPHFAGIAVGGLSVGESYLLMAKVRVPALSPDVYACVGYKTSGHKMAIKDQDTTILLAFTADDTSAVFGIESPGTSGTCLVKGLSLYTVNQKGFPNYIYDGSGWVETLSIAQKTDIYSRVNTFGNQVIRGTKQFSEQLWAGPMPNGNPFMAVGSSLEPGTLPAFAVSQDNSAGGFSGMVIRGAVGSAAVDRTAGIIFKMSNEEAATETYKGWELGAYSGAVWGNGPDFFIKNAYTNRNSIRVTNATDQVSLAGFILSIGRAGTTADASTLIMNGADAGAGGGGAEIRMSKNGAAKWSIYTLGSGDGNLYIRDQANAKMVATFMPGGTDASMLSVTDLLHADRIRSIRCQDISGTDLNSLTFQGTFNGSSMTNAPDSGWWYIESMIHTNLVSNYAVQRAVELVSNAPRVFVRSKTAGTWNAWQPMSLVTTPWTNLSYANSWANYGAPYQIGQYRKVGDEVQLRGLIRNGTVNTTMFTLPTGFRPPDYLIFPGVSAGPATYATGAASTGTAHTHSQVTPPNIAVRVNVNTDGTVVAPSTSTGFIDLSAIRFSVTA